MPPSILRVLMAAAWFGAPFAAAQNGVLYTDLAAGESYDSTGTNYYDALGGQPNTGALFTATSSGPLAQVLVPTSNPNGSTTFSLYEANGTCIPTPDPIAGILPNQETCSGTLGTLLESWEVPTPTTPIYSSQATQPQNYAIPSIPLTALLSVAHPTITAGNQYWFTVNPGQLTFGLCPSGQQALQTGMNLNGPFPGTTCDSGGGDLTEALVWENADSGTGGFWNTGAAGAMNFNVQNPALALELDSVITYYFPHLAFGGGWQSELTLVNYTPLSTSCTTTFYSDSGSALQVPFTGGSVASRLDNLAAGADIHVLTQAAAGSALLTGWAEAQCTGPVKASLLYRIYGGNTAQGEAGVNAVTEPATEFVSFAQTQTGIAYANPQSTAATLTVTAFDPTGKSLGSTTFDLAPGAHAQANIGPLLGLQNFSGSVQVTSTVPIIVLLVNAEVFPVFSSLPPADVVTGTALSSGTAGAVGSVTTYYFPHLAIGGGWQTTFTFVNYSPQTVSCQTTFYSDSGGALMAPFAGGSVSSRTDNLPAGASVHVQTQAAANSALLSGWAQSQCTGPVKASLLYRIYSAGGVAQGEAGVNATTTPTTEFVSFAQTFTGIAYANPSTTTTATLTITVLDATGASLGSTTVVLQPGEHNMGNIGPLLGLNTFSGSVQVISTSPIVVVLVNAEVFPVFSSLPPADLPAGTPLALEMAD